METISTDVLVVGSGAAGLAAAISSARNGAKTLLVERAGFVGGISSTLPWLGFHDREYRQVVKGFAHASVTRLQRMKAASGYIIDPKCSSFVSIDRHMWKATAMQLLEEAGVTVMLQTLMVDTIREVDRIAGIIVEHKSGRQEIRAKLTIDCSGDGDVAARGDVEWQKGRTGDGLVQAPTLVFSLQGVDRDRFVQACKNPENKYREWLSDNRELWDKMMKHIDSAEGFVLGGFAGLMRKAREAGGFDVPQTRVVGVKTHRRDEIMVVMTRVLGLDPTDVMSMSFAYSRVYRQIPQLLGFFREFVPGCESSFVGEIAPMLGVRESRRIVGDYMLTKEDLIEGRVFDDAVAMGGYHIDIHRPKGTWVESHNVRAYTIPLRSLIAANVNGLMMAGKCISATHEAIASTRVIPICMAEGEAAGTAAALAVMHSAGDVRGLETGILQEQLLKQGAEIGTTLGSPNQELIDEYGQLPLGEDETEGNEDEVSAGDGVWV